MDNNKKAVELILIGIILIVSGIFLADYIKGNAVVYSSLLVLFSSYFLKGNKFSINLLAITVSLVYVFFIYSAYPQIYYDDTGFIIRYFNNFWEGYWFKFNIQDEPVFGLSGFLYGLVGGTLCYFKLLFPEDAINLLSALGIFFTSFLIFKIQNKIFKQTNLVFLFWILCMFGNTYFLNSANKGLETPFHMAIVLGAYYFFLSGNNKLMWLFMGLSVASKLDAVPSMIILGIVYIVKIFTDKKPLDRFVLFLKNEFLYAAGVVVVYLVLTFIIFGSPLPHSGATKFTFHQSKLQHWFPFLEPLTNQNSYSFILYSFVVLYSATVFLLKKIARDERLIALVFGLSFIVTMALYYIYNPFERMMWYYPLPLFFMFIQLTVSIYYISKTIFEKYQLHFQLTLFIVLASSMFNFVIQDQGYGLRSMLTTELQREQIGYDVAARTHANDTIAAHHGLVTCRTDAYVLDMTGLNSKLMSEVNFDLLLTLNKYKPKWYENHINDWCLSILNENGSYHIDRQYYGFVQYGYQPITLFSRDVAAKHVFEKVRPENITSVKEVQSFGDVNIFISNKLELKEMNFDKFSFLNFGIDRFGIDYFLIIEEYNNDQLIYRSKIYISSVSEEIPSEKTIPIIHQIQSDNVTSLVIKSEIDWLSIHISTPILERIIY